MILSRQKQNFVLDKAIEAINTSHDYSMDNMSYSKTFNLKYESLRGNSYRVSLYFYQNVLSKVTLYRQGGDVEIDLDGNDKKFKTIEEFMYNKVKEIDDIKFKKIFPEYDTIEERNDILDELLKEEEEVVKEEVKEEVKKTKWFNTELRG